MHSFRGRAPALAVTVALLASPAAALAKADDKEPQNVTASEIVVLGTRGKDYRIDELTTATRTGTDLMDVPQSIQFVPRDVIDDQQIIDLTSALRNVSGIQAGTTAGNRSESFTIRGFRSSYYAIDSIMLSPAVETNDSFRDLANVERIEVLKGPASVLYGRGDPGGLINIVTKQPRFTPGMNFSIQGGSDNFVRGQADVTGPIDRGQTLAVRVIGAVQYGDGFRDSFVPFKRQFGSASFLWQPSARTRLIASATYAHQNNQTDRGIVATPDGAEGYRIDLPRKRFLGEAFAVTDSHRAEFNYRFEHQLADWLTVRQIGHYDRGQLDLFGINNGNTVTTNAVTSARTITRTAVEQHEQNHSSDFQADIVATVSTGPIGHTVVFGLERVQSYRFRTFAQATLAAIDIDDPVYGARPGTFVPRADRTVRARANSAYLQDQIAIGDRFDLLAGIRFDHARQSDLGTTQYASDDKAWSPRVGIVWKPVPTLSLFADYTRSFQSKPEPTLTGEPVPPESGEQYEAGLKANAFGKRLSATLAFYRLTRNNVTQQDPNNVGFNINAGRQRSRGVELDVAGSFTSSLKVIANGTYTDAKVIESTDYATGNSLIGVPKWSGSLWLTFEPDHGTLQGFGIGSGIYAASDRQGDLENSFSLGGYTRLDASAWYSMSRTIRLTLNVKNLNDDHYIESTVSRAQVTPAAGRTFLAGLSGSF
ncbi:TonB-dependent siderophore receptor [Sphingomonas sp. LB3N6]|uniref:TonB-dependent siderophore receptor n=1 Tax=Sphingomonas fucosidasi TaxID=3096164 RepID=UPI002FC71726